MNSSIDPYETLSKCGVHLPAHIIYLLKKLGYNSLIAISKIDPLNIKSIEMIIIKVFGNELRRNAMTEEEKLLHFGEIFSKFPDSFQILPGEEVSIQSAVEISNRILKTNEVPLLQINNPNSKRKFVPLKPNEFQPKPTTSHEDDGTVKDSYSGAAAGGTSKTPIKTRRSLSEHVEKWCTKNTKDLDFTFSDCEVDEETLSIFCTKCTKKKGNAGAKAFLTAEGLWKISNFIRHVKVSSI